MGIFTRLGRHAPALLAVAAVIGIQFQFGSWLLECEAARRSPALRRMIWVAVFLISSWIAFGMLGGFRGVYFFVPSSPLVAWVRGTAALWTLASLGAYFILLLWRRLPRFDAERRWFIRAAGGAFVAAPFAALGYGMFIERTSLRVREISVPMPNLPKDLDGLRLVQLSDIHLSPFLSEREVARAVGMANELRADVALVTGDLITSRADPLEACVRQLARLRAGAGILGCLGNHEVYANVEDEAAGMGARAGIRFLRQQALPLRFGDATLNVAGVDYQRMGSRYLAGTEGLMMPGVVNILLSHNPEVFNLAEERGWDLTISGHTHGGQVTVEILHEDLNFARFYTPYIYGLYRRNRSSLWVTRGIGTVGVPSRVGAPPEVALIRLCAI